MKESFRELKEVKEATLPLCEGHLEAPIVYCGRLHMERTAINSTNFSRISVNINDHRVFVRLKCSR